MENVMSSPPKVTQSLDLHDLDELGIKCEASFSNDSSQLDEDKCYLLEIQQLKRENNFLKKKIAELNKKQRVSLPVSAKKRVSGAVLASSEQKLQEPSKNYILSFIEEIVKLLQNFGSLFKIEVQTNINKELEKQNALFNQLTTDKNCELNQRLTRILLQPEQKKYKQLLELFEDYYRENSERNKHIRQRVESLTTEAIDIGNKMAQSIIQREQSKRSIKGSHIFSVIREEEIKPIREECMNSSIIKSTCTDEHFDLGSCRIGLSKQKMFLGLF